MYEKIRMYAREIWVKQTGVNNNNGMTAKQLRDQKVTQTKDIGKLEAQAKKLAAIEAKKQQTNKAYGVENA